ncbi:triphosphoribosyl-dephospho-CoA synthase [Bifidobacterium bohemicum]|uniref:Probable 2-(5''-triphosphoribosyl)-3'-dephosphocoenzyme-A synthase n=1 Tax=Bifidobacterium bohemicum DSM 22767 TaxID=1437606 RepID=A0A086ZEV0_9BIFI|nr:triphosphoribosyl-dephospho-CoA synthase CitG [Bifidobacterium bohemicum]KFI45050.1 triphosphoribosyl-dephospho-CoA synthase [Bifidobacterium bohemicum DSM 22767]SCB92738.1 triphosphoribosyl-dephospho-CoA synthase [Bifidobacterium bohemicum]
MQYDSRFIAQAAVRALLYEVSVHPKPGLVDPVGSGPHPDMTVFTFIDSAVALRDYFDAAARCGADFAGADLTALFERLRALGRGAEREMFEATDGVNTHKGAVFSLGVAVGATSHYCKSHDYGTTGVQEVIKRMLAGFTARDLRLLEGKPDFELTAGERQYLKTGATGVRGEAEAGFPSVIDVALPLLRGSRGNGDLNTRLLDVLMLLAGRTEDSNLVKRAGDPAVLDWMHDRSERYFSLGGAGTEAGMRLLGELNEECLERNLSLGGSADLLILTIFFGFMEGIM